MELAPTDPGPPDPLRTAATLLEIPAADIGEDDDLFELGLDSLTVIRTASAWRRHGLAVSFEDLATEPTVRGWRAVLATAGATVAQPAGPSSTTDLPDGAFPLAPMQYAYWVGRQDGQPFGGVGSHFSLEFDAAEALDPARLQQAFTAVVDRHPMLRVRILDDGTQRITDTTGFPDVTVHDLRALTDDERAATLARLRDELSHRRMDPSQGEVVALALALLPTGSRLQVDLDMTVGDALSLAVLLDDLAACYTGRPLTPLALDFPRYLRERDTPGTAQARAEDANWWAERLPDLPRGPGLPVVATEGPARMARHHHLLDPDTAATFERHARHRGLTPAAALTTAFAEVLATWCDGPRFLINLPLFTREPVHPDVDRLVGDFTGSVLLDADLSRSEAFTEQARELQSRLHAAVGHAAYGGVDVLRDLTRRTGAPVLAPVVHTSSLGLGDMVSAATVDTFGEPVWVSSQNPQVWLDAQVRELTDGILLNWDVRADVLGDDVPTALFAAYVALVTGLAAGRGWDVPVGSTAPAAQLATRERTHTDGTRLPRRGLHAAFFAAARATPDRPAVLAEPGRTGDPLTYGELADRALRLAGALQDNGVRPGDTVALSLPRGSGLVTAILGVLAAGAAYVPVACDQPEQRRQRILDRAGVRLLLADARPSDTGPPVLDPADVAGHEPLPGPLPISPDDLAYVLFTSGSTGEPKGVEVPHSAAVATIAAIGDRFGVGADARTLLVSAPEFDLSVYDLFAPLSVGGAVVPLADDERRDPVRWWELVRRHDVTVWNTVPVLLDMLLTAYAGGPVPLRTVLLGGDWVTPDLAVRLHAVAPAARFVALGGMTEAAIHSTVCEVHVPDPTWRAVPWGTPLDGVRCRVVDERGRDRPDLVAGELWVGGVGVARGYRGDPERTADRFVGHDGVRWYRSGDLARYLPDGSLDFLGRADHQVKVRGHRIELGEVEAALASHPGVSRAVALVRDNRIVAAVAGTADPDALAAHQAELLPEVMRADPVVVLDALPLTVNGKPDRAAIRALLESSAGERGGSGEQARPGVEQRLAAVWADVLGLTDPPSRDDGFFAVGGDSLLATRMLAELPAAGLSGGKLGALFGAPRLADFAATLSADSGTTSPATADAGENAVVADPAHRYEPFPVTDVQAAYLLGRQPAFTLGGVGTWQYAEFDGPEGSGPGEVDLDRLATVWDRLVARHEMLRAVVDPDGRQRILATTSPTRIEVTDGDPEALRAECSHRLIDLSRWPLHELRAVRYRGDAGETRIRLAVGLDYLLFDALSIMTVFTELDALYADPDRVLDPIEVSFRDYVLQVHPDPADVARDEEHWRARLAELPAPPRLPLRVEPAAHEQPRFTRRTHQLDPERWAALSERARAAGLTPSTTLLAAYTEVLSAWSESPELTVTLTLFNRLPRHRDVFRVLGDFTSLTLADHRPADSWLQTARGLQRRLGTDLDHRDASPAWLLRELAARTGTLDSAAPVVFTSALGVGDGRVSMDMSPAFPPRVFGISQSPQVSLDNQVLESGGGLQVTWDAVDELFREGVLDAMFAAYTGLLDHLATHDWDGPLPDLLPADQRAVRTRVNDTGAPLPVEPLHVPFFAAADERGDAPALVWDGGELGHAALADRALRVAADLAARGVRPGDAVAVTLPKGPDQVVAVLGVLAAGACYVPVGIDQPPVRRARVHEAAQVRHVIDTLTLADEPLPAPVPVSPNAPAYVIFTSGSTGTPKGVQVRHAAAANTVADVSARYGVGPGDRVLAVSALDFDLSVYDVFGLLAAGGALVLPAEDERRDAVRWRDLCVAHGVTVWNTVPTLLEMLLVAGLPPTLRLAMVSGDRVPTDLHERLGADVRLVAMGGATEGAIWSNAFEPAGTDLAGWASMPYGTPLTAQRYRVVGPDGRDRPDWAPGELWIGGRGVADGYRGDPERTAERFVVHAGARWYRTGDVGRYRPDGLLEFLGRMDQQIKIGGHRLELGEVEAALTEHPDIDAAVVVAVGPPTARRLHAFVTGAAPDGLTGFLTERVAVHAVPGTVTLLDALPLTSNGKLDRAELTRRAETDAPAAGAPPAGPLESALAALWVELLELPDTPPRDVPFFTAGGSSLGALRLLAAVAERFGVDVPARRFLASPTIAALAAEVDAAAPDQETGTL